MTIIENLDERWGELRSYAQGLPQYLSPEKIYEIKAYQFKLFVPEIYEAERAFYRREQKGTLDDEFLQYYEYLIEQAGLAEDYLKTEVWKRSSLFDDIVFYVQKGDDQPCMKCIDIKTFLKKYAKYLTNETILRPEIQWGGNLYTLPELCLAPYLQGMTYTKAKPLLTFAFADLKEINILSYGTLRENPLKIPSKKKNTPRTR